MSDFTVQLVSATIAAAQATRNAVSPTDFHELADISRAFFLPAVWPMTSAGWGKTTGAVNNSLLNTDATAQIAATDTITFADGDTTIARTTAAQVWLLEYVGPDGGPNQITPRGTTGSTEFVMTLPSGSSTADSGPIVGITNAAKCVPRVTSYGTGNTNNYNSHLFSLDIVDTGGGVYVVRISRNGTNGTMTIRGQVLEFGSAWSVQKVAHPFSAGNTNEDETITAVDTTHSFVLHAVFQNLTAQPAQATCYSYLANSTTLRHRLHSKASGTISMTSWVISHPLLNVARYGTPNGTADLTGAGSGVQTHPITITAVPDLSQAMVIGQAGALTINTTAAPCLYSAFALANATTAQIKKSEALGDIEYVLQVLDWSGVVSARIDTVSAIVDGQPFTITGLFGASPVVTLGPDAVTVTNATSSAITCTGAIGTKFYDQTYELRVVDAIGGVAVSQASVAPAAGTEYTTLIAPLVMPSQRPTSSPIDFAGGHQIRWQNPDVDVFSNLIFRYDPDETSVQFSGNDGTGWSPYVTHTLAVLSEADPPDLVGTVPNFLVPVNGAAQINVAPYATQWDSIAIIGTLPTGLVDEPDTQGLITGTPTVVETRSVVARYFNGDDSVDSNAFSITVTPKPIVIGTPSDLSYNTYSGPQLIDFKPYFTGASTYAITAAQFPFGWAFENGVLTVVPSIAGTYGPFTVSATNAAGTESLQPFQVHVFQFSIEVRAIHDGYYGGELRQAGERFSIYAPVEFSPYWMEYVTTPPAEWVAQSEALDREVQRLIIKQPADLENTPEPFRSLLEGN